MWSQREQSDRRGTDLLSATEEASIISAPEYKPHKEIRHSAVSRSFWITFIFITHTYESDRPIFKNCKALLMPAVSSLHIDPAGDYSSYFHKTTSDGGELDFDNITGFGPEHWTLTTNDVIQWGLPYQMRVHYYSDHNSSFGTIPTRWTATILLYEGTSRAKSFTYSGVLASDNSSNHEPTDTGSDWADIATIIPVRATTSLSRTIASPSVTRETNGHVTITVPIPSAEECSAIKSASENAQEPVR